MFTYQIAPNSTDVSVTIRFIDSVTGLPETGVDHATAGIDMKYRRTGSATVDITEASLAALTTAHTDGGMEQIGQGYVRLDLPDAAVASGAAECLVFGTATDMVVIGCLIQLEAAVTAIKTETASILTDTAEIGTAGAGLTNINLPNQTMDITGNITGNLSGSVGSVTGAVGSVTGAVGSVTGAVGSVTAGVTLANDAITAAKFDESTAFPLVSADSGSTQVARTGADADTLETLSDEIAAVKAETALIVADTNELQTDWTDAGRLDAILDARASQTTADAIEADTQNIQTRLPAALNNGVMPADIQRVNDVEIVGDGDGTPFNV